MQSDLNTAGALGAVFELVRALNSAIDAGELGRGDVPVVLDAFTLFDAVLGIVSLRRAEEELPPVPIEEIERLIEERHAARRRRDFAAADRVRDDLAARGVLLEDSPAGTRWKRSRAMSNAPIIKTPLPGPKAKALIDRDRSVVSPSYTRGYPLVIDHATGSIVEDVDGNVFLDCAAGIAVNATGHSHPDVVKAIADQAARFIHMSGTDFYYEPQVRLAEEIAAIAPFDGGARSFFGNSGAEAIEAAIKLARHATGTAGDHCVPGRIPRPHARRPRVDRIEDGPAPRVQPVHGRRLPCAVPEHLPLSARHDARRLGGVLPRLHRSRALWSARRSRRGGGGRHRADPGRGRVRRRARRVSARPA